MKKSSLELNAKEAEVLRKFPSPKNREDLGEPISLSDLARDAFPKKGTSPTTKGNSWVRNSMRKLLRLKLVKHSGAKSGKYMRTMVNLADLKREAEAEAAAKEAKKEAKKGAKKKAAEGGRRAKAKRTDGALAEATS